VFISIQPSVQELSCSRKLFCFSLQLQQEKEGRKDADPQAVEVLIDETGGEPVVRDLSIFLRIS